MTEEYRCYFISRDGKGRSLASVVAEDPMAAVKAAIARFHLHAFRRVEVWLRSDRVLVYEVPHCDLAPAQ